MTNDDLERRAIIAAHGASCPGRCGEDVSTYLKLTRREQAIVALWRDDRERVLALADRVENRMMATAKPSEIRAALDRTETSNGR